MRYIEDMGLRLVNDFIFLYVFGRDEGNALLLDLVNAVLQDADRRPVRSLELKNPARRRDGFWARDSILDILAVADDGSQFDIEMQVSRHPAFINRSLYYWAETYAGQLTSGQEYTTLRPVVCINLIDFVLFPDSNENHHRFIITDARNPEYVLAEDLQIHFVELIKASPRNSYMSKWVTLLENIGMEGFDMSNVVFSGSKIFPEVYRLYERCTQDEQLRLQALARERFQRDRISDLAGARRDGKAEGKTEVARRMLERGMTLDAIADITGLPLEELQILVGEHPAG